MSGSERKLTEEARELSRAGVVVALDSAPRVQRMKAKLAECADAIEASRAREQRKDQALRPFARVADELEGSEYEGNYAILWRSGRPSVTLEHSDFVRARQALAAVPVETQEAAEQTEATT